MSRKVITIGDVSMPLEDYAIVGNAILGIKGAGKTFLAKSIAEQLLDHNVQPVIFDPIGVWRHLRRPAPGRNGKGFRVVVAGGQEPDLPLTVQSAPEVVRAAIRENVPLVIDLYDRNLSKGDWRKIVRACCRVLFYENTPVTRHIIVEEAAEFVPQRIDDGETYAELEKIVRMGGNVALGITLVNQRSQEVNKAVLELCENLILMRQRGAKAIEALTKWVGMLNPDMAEQIKDGLPDLETGYAWVFAGAGSQPKLTRCAPIRSFHPDRKRPELLAQAGAPADLGDFVSRMTGELATLIEQVEANDPRKLKARIAELERALKDGPTPRINHAVLDEQSRQITELMHEKHVLEQHRDAIADAYEQLRDRVEELTHGPLLELAGIAQRACEDFKTLPPFPAPTKPSAPPPTARTSPTRLALPSRPAAVAAPRSSKANGSAAPSALTKGQIAILTAIVQHPEGVEAGQLTLLAGYARSTRDRLLQELRSLGHVAPGWPARATETAIAALGADYEPLPTGDELRAWWLQRLDQGGRTMLETLAGAYPRGIDRDDLGERTGYARSTRDRLLQELRARKLVESRGREVFASEALFG